MNVDPPAELRAAIVAQNNISALTGPRVYAQRDTPPPGYTPEKERAICFKTRPLGEIDEEGQTITQSFQIKFYGKTETEAYDLYRTFFGGMNYLKNYRILMISQETPGQALFERDTQWIFVQSFFMARFLNI
jgi:hypothetical protein